MNLWKSKKAQIIETEVFTMPAFWILLAIAWGATILGFSGAGLFNSQEAVKQSYPFIMKILILFGEFVACYFFALRSVNN